MKTGKEIRMTSKEYEQRLEALEREIAALKLETVEDGSEIPPHPKPEIRLHQEYYYVAPYGGIIYTKYDGARTEKMMRDIGNVFLAEEAAEYAAEYFKVLSEMREWAGEWNDPWRIYYNEGDIKPSAVFMNQVISYGDVRFATEADAKNCIKAVGKDRLIKYYFGVRDHEIPAETE